MYNLVWSSSVAVYDLNLNICFHNYNRSRLIGLGKRMCIYEQQFIYFALKTSKIKHLHVQCTMLPYFTILLYLHYTLFHCYISSLNKSVFVIVTIQFVLIITILSVWWWWKKNLYLRRLHINLTLILPVLWLLHYLLLFLIHIYYILCRSKSIPNNHSSEDNHLNSYISKYFTLII